MSKCIELHHPKRQNIGEYQAIVPKEVIMKRKPLRVLTMESSRSRINSCGTHCLLTPLSTKSRVRRYTEQLQKSCWQVLEDTVKNIEDIKKGNNIFNSPLRRRSFLRPNFNSSNILQSKLNKCVLIGSVASINPQRLKNRKVLQTLFKNTRLMFKEEQKMKRNNRILSLYKKCEKQEKKELYLNQDEDMKSHLLKLCTPWSKTRLDSCGSENGDEESVSQGN